MCSDYGTTWRFARDGQNIAGITVTEFSFSSRATISAISLKRSLSIYRLIISRFRTSVASNELRGFLLNTREDVTGIS